MVSALTSVLSDWLARLEQAHPHTIELGLERVAQVCDAMRLQPSFPVILVGGTNGKGSTCAYLESILRVQGCKTGLYTSPHLLRYNERVRINGLESNDDSVVAGLEAVEAARGNISLTYFEHGTLAAMWQFMQAGVDVAIIEVGLGGRLDATNIFEPDASIVTSVDLDHQAWLGNTREAIGFEKAGIYRAGKPAICGDPDPPRSLVEHARNIGADLIRTGPDFGHESQEQCWEFFMRGIRLPGLPFPALTGKHQLRNAASALAALAAVGDHVPVTISSIRQGLMNVRLPGRFQKIQGPVEIVLDVAHNPESARALAENLRSRPARGKNHAVFALLADKDAEGVITPLKDIFDTWFVAGLSGERGQSGKTLAAKLGNHAKGRISIHVGPSDAFSAARLEAFEGDRIVVFGSFHAVAEILKTVS
jgi:dihydrofolate synthase/folylpolyglutamate synthase